LGFPSLPVDSSSFGSSVSPRSLSRMGLVPSVMNFAMLGSSASARSLARVGFSMSAPDLFHSGSSLSPRSHACFGSSLSIAGKVHFNAENTYLNYDDAATNPTLEVYVNAYRAISMSQKSSFVGGALHGAWYADNMVYISDRRLKTSIRPLVAELDARAASAGAVMSSVGDGAAWVLRQLRPVSYYFKRDAEAKHQRFGFIAQEVAETIPQVVQEDTSRAESVKGIVYQDFIAIFTAILQSVSGRLEKSESGHADMKTRLDAMELSFSRLQTAMESGYEKLRASLGADGKASEDTTKKLADLEARLSRVEAWMSLR